MNKPLLKACLSTLLLATLVVICISGLGLWLSSSGLVLGLPRILVKRVHGICSLVMTAAAIPHFISNFKLYCAEWRQGRRKLHEEQK